MSTAKAVAVAILAGLYLILLAFVLHSLPHAKKEKKNMVFEMTSDAVFIALIIIMTFVPNLGYIAISPFISFTLLHLPVLLAAALGGPKKGALVGLFFGLSSYLQALLGTSGLNALFAYPWVAIPPRVIFGFVAGIVFSSLEKISKGGKRSLYLAIASFALTVLHTVLVFLDLFIFFPDTVGGLLSSTEPVAEATKLTFLAIIGLGMSGEAVIALIITPALTLAVEKAVPALSRGRGKRKELR